MPPVKSLGSVVSKVGRSMGSRRNFCSSPGSSNVLMNVDVKSVVAGFAVRAIPFCVGYGVAGPFVFGDTVAYLEEERKKEWRKIYGESVDSIGDVRDVVVPGLGLTVYSYLSANAARWWSWRKSSAARWWSGRKS
ncbi:hypothetical protein ISN45_Aa02g021910 [Arabidopsis thaliana x Arabidopsis arenosa]|uniref:Uncharacterized protein n=1 Tax=Arabidopsis thaliana x Arabidopsis arenosa TaxID=1240361 RepID=A0A8T2BPK1_9BRAS|nr:hypothetical protein ISN45_Aa02g021910 [Arabidopsis thaliana x Arabidopsis arenosa]